MTDSPMRHKPEKPNILICAVTCVDNLKLCTATLGTTGADTVRRESSKCKRKKKKNNAVFFRNTVETYRYLQFCTLFIYEKAKKVLNATRRRSEADEPQSHAEK